MNRLYKIGTWLRDHVFGISVPRQAHAPIYFQGHSSHVAMYMGYGNEVRQATDCSAFFFEDLEARFDVGQLVIVHSKVYGDWFARVEDRSKQKNGTWRYDVSDGFLLVSYDRSYPRRQNVPEEIMEPFSPSQVSTPAPTGSAEADAILYYLNPPSLPGSYGYDPANKPQLEPLHRDFLLAIEHVHNVIGDLVFAEKMRDDLVDLWYEDKVAKGLDLPEALGMTDDQYSHWVEKKVE